MISTSSKPNTLRVAQAQSIFCAPAEIIELIKSGKGPKGNALEIAKVAGVMAGKKTWELIPYCHQLPIDQIAISYEFESNSIKVLATATAVWKTGVEMEALIAAQICAITIYDMLKPLEKEMSVQDTRLLSKRGGKSDFKEDIPINFKAAVIVTSDGTSQGKRKDRSGMVIRDRLKAFGIDQIEYLILPDEKELIQKALISLCEKRFDLIFTTGGTGLGPRDVTVEATQEIIEQEIPGIIAATRHHGQMRTPYAMLSRGVAGRMNNTIIVTLPGSSNGAKESLDAIFPSILHAFPMMNGGGHQPRRKVERR